MPLKSWNCTRFFTVFNFLVTEAAIVLFFLYEDNFGQKYANKYHLQYIVRMISFCAHFVNMGIALRRPQKNKKRRIRSCILRVTASAMVGCTVMMDPMMSVTQSASETLAEHARGTFITAMVVNLVFCIIYPAFYIIHAGKYYAKAPVRREEYPLMERPTRK
ncbi:hypothetical protein GGI15_002625 [Coemansia interrupta]|uniref:Uncharacterized protein n=1 Tax=Coemansia interrupta TaxID=1126814 RepID=A0A9W8LKW9_9FUNG|nr:hypothetical protein GGI15_002625 [Coemansia interrupta]